MRARDALVEAIRAKADGLGGVEDFLHAYSLSTKEGLALMVLAEALLRVPDAAHRRPADRGQARRRATWLDSDIKSTALLVSASAWTLGIAAAHHPSGRDAGRHHRTARASGSACRRCAPRRGRRCG